MAEFEVRVSDREADAPEQVVPLQSTEQIPAFAAEHTPDRYRRTEEEELAEPLLPRED